MAKKNLNTFWAFSSKHVQFYNALEEQSDPHIQRDKQVFKNRSSYTINIEIKMAGVQNNIVHCV